MNQPDLPFSFKEFDAEEFFIRRLKDHRREIHAGVTDRATRRERIRSAILEAGLDCVIVGRNAAGRPETYAELFQRHFREPLQLKAKGETRGHTDES